MLPRLVVSLSMILAVSMGCKKDLPADKPAAAPNSIRKESLPADEAAKPVLADIRSQADTAQAPPSESQKEQPLKGIERSKEALPKEASGLEASKAAGPRDKAENQESRKPGSDPGPRAVAEPVAKPEEPKTQLDLVPPIPVKVPGKAMPAVPAIAEYEASATAPPAGPAGAASPSTYTPPPFLNVDETRAEVRAREGMVKMLMTGYRHAITDERVLKAMGTVPRHEYLLPENRAEGYNQMWFRIGHGQTITDPGMVAWMTQLLAIKATDKVLEIGTGSGYQGSVLAQLTPNVYTIEIVEPLANRTYKLLERFGVDKILKHRIGDGYYGWEEEAPFDKIIVTCAADHIPILLLQQLKPGGLMVIPVGPRYQPGKLHFIAKDAQGKIHKKVLGKVDFVPMTRLKDWGKTDDRDAKRKELEKQSKELRYEETP